MRSRRVQVVGGLLAIIMGGASLLSSGASANGALPKLAAASSAGRPNSYPFSGKVVNANSTVTSLAGYVSGGTTFDPRSHTADGSGSLKVDSSGYLYTAGAIPVTPGDEYTLSMYVRTDQWPPATAAMFLGIVSADGGWIEMLGRSLTGVSPSGPNKWTEVSSSFVIPTTAKFVQPRVDRRVDQAAPAAELLVDDIRLTPGVAMAEAPAQKRAFNGTQTRIDELGNWEVFENGVWTPWFPLCVAANSQRPESGGGSYASVLRAGGYNCDIWNGYEPYMISRAKAAGMRSFAQIAQYTDKSNTWGTFNNPTALIKNINAINASPDADYLAGYWWDNENNPEAWAVPKLITDTIKATDQVNGVRRRPILVLDGNWGQTNQWADANGVPFADAVGTYASSAGGNTGGAGSGSPAAHITIDSMQDQTMPSAMCQINDGIGVMYRTAFYACLAYGSKAMSFFADGNSAHPVTVHNPIPVEQQSFFPDVKVLENEVAKLMPLLRQPHWTSWSLVPASGKRLGPIAFGTRQMNGEGYAILANQTTAAQSESYSLTGLSGVTEVRDYFTNAVLAPVIDGKFTLTIEGAGVGKGTRVVRFVGEGLSVTNGDPIVTVPPTTVATTVATTLPPTTAAPTTAAPTTVAPTTVATTIPPVTVATTIPATTTPATTSPVTTKPAMTTTTATTSVTTKPATTTTKAPTATTAPTTTKPVTTNPATTAPTTKPATTTTKPATTTTKPPAVTTKPGTTTSLPGTMSTTTTKPASGVTTSTVASGAQANSSTTTTSIPGVTTTVAGSVTTQQATTTTSVSTVATTKVPTTVLADSLTKSDTSSQSGTLAKTGTNYLGILLIAFGLVLAGFGLVGEMTQRSKLRAQPLFVK